VKVIGAVAEDSNLAVDDDRDFPPLFTQPANEYVTCRWFICVFVNVSVTLRVVSPENFRKFIPIFLEISGKFLEHIIGNFLPL